MNSLTETDRVMIETLDAIIDSSFDGLWLCDNEGRVVRVNKASEEINSINAEQVVGRKMEELVKEGLVDCSVTLKVLERKAPVTMIQNLKNGKHILVTGNPVFDKQGKISFVVVNDRDLTELNKIEDELKKQRTLSKEYFTKLSEMQAWKSHLDEIVVRNEAMYRILETAAKVSQVDSVVLIQGESGTGKGMISRFIHQISKRSDGPFVRLDCGAIPEPLIESELFGYKSGAFTGASKGGKLGYFEIAEGGTLFLDEIGELPLSVQVKLLRFLEANEFVPVGATLAKRIDTRIVAATNRDLGEMVDKSLFRKDLFFRLNVIPIKIPPLRERVDDIPPLIHFLLKKFSDKYSSNKVILPRAVDCFCSYPFPGNIRELANMIEQLVVLVPHEQISQEDLPLHVRDGMNQRKRSVNQNEWNLREETKKLETEIILKALRTFGTQRNAAKHMGINQSTLARKIQRYGIDASVILHQNNLIPFGFRADGFSGRVE